MREFVVILRSGVRYAVRAERVVWEPPYVALVLARGAVIGEPHTGDSDTVAMFAQQDVVALFSREHLVSEEKGDPITSAGGYAGAAGDPIPF